MKKVVVASTNPVKINTAKIGFSEMFPEQEFDVTGVSAESGVSDQPMSEEETLQGANNRAENAQRAMPDADFWVGIEGGLQEVGGQLEAFAWMVVKSNDGKEGKGKTGSFFLPEKVAELVRDGMELGHADDKVFGRENSKQANGAVGILTNDVITRTTYYVPALVFALIPFKNPELY